MSSCSKVMNKKVVGGGILNMVKAAPLKGAISCGRNGYAGSS